MPLTWMIDHGRRLSTLTLTGPLDRADIEPWLAERLRGGSTGYRVIFDASAAQLELHSSELAAFTRMAGGRRVKGTDGAIALIASSDAEQELGAYLARGTSRERPCRIFSTVEAAQAWFIELDAAAGAF